VKAAEQPTLVVLSPHPDDETLSMGAYIAGAVHAGRLVEVVGVTDGSATNAIVSINKHLRRAGYPPTDRQGIVAARQAEMVAAMARLGVGPEHVHFAGYIDGQLTVADAASVLDAYAIRFPAAQFLTSEMPCRTTATLGWPCPDIRSSTAAGQSRACTGRDAAPPGTALRTWSLASSRQRRNTRSGPRRNVWLWAGTVSAGNSRHSPATRAT